jgi:hypothetical protein
MFYGALRFFTFISIPQGDGSFRMKKSTLATSHCDYADIERKTAEFREANSHIRPSDIHARFEYSEHVG